MHGGDHRQTIRAKATLARLLDGAGRDEESERLCLEAFSQAQSLLGMDDLYTQDLVRDIPDFYEKLGKENIEMGYSERAQQFRGMLEE